MCPTNQPHTPHGEALLALERQAGLVPALADTTIILKGQETKTQKIVTSRFEVDGRQVDLIDFEDEKGRVQDSIMRDSNGEEIDDAALFEQLETFLDQQAKEKA